MFHLVKIKVVDKGIACTCVLCALCMKADRGLYLFQPAHGLAGWSCQGKDILPG